MDQQVQAGRFRHRTLCQLPAGVVEEEVTCAVRMAGGMIRESSEQRYLEKTLGRLVPLAAAPAADIHPRFRRNREGRWFHCRVAGVREV